VYGVRLGGGGGGGGEEDGGATLDDMRKRRQATDFLNLEEECEVAPDGRVQEAFVRAGGLGGVAGLLEAGPASTTQPAAALLMDALCCACHLAAVHAVQVGGESVVRERCERERASERDARRDVRCIMQRA
jgi:hypothetical protein